MNVIDLGFLGVQGLLGLAMVGAGGAKLAGVEFLIEEFERYGYPQWFRLVTGAIQVVAGLGLLMSLVAIPLLALGGGLLIAVTMTGGLLTHVRIGDSLEEMVPAAILLGLALVVSWNTVGGLG